MQFTDDETIVTIRTQYICIKTDIKIVWRVIKDGSPLTPTRRSGHVSRRTLKPRW